jgi:hypothetical protein
MARFFLGDAKFRVNRLKLPARCPKFYNLKLLPYWVQSPTTEEAFPVFVSALGGTDPVLMTGNTNDCGCLAMILVLPTFSPKFRISFRGTR